jgi:hypothetical protein
LSETLKLELPVAHAAIFLGWLLRQPIIGEAGDAVGLDDEERAAARLVATTLRNISRPNLEGRDLLAQARTTIQDDRERWRRRMIEILRDTSLSITDRDDAAIELANYNSPDAREALLAAGSNASEDETVLDSIGESLAQLHRGNPISRDAVDTLTPIARNSLLAVLEQRHWPAA